jgi:chromosome segregation ATPase
MRSSIFILAVVAAIAPCDGHAESEIDRLRDALRQAIRQTRALEDQHAALQARKIESDRELERLKSQIEEGRNAIKTAEKERADAVNEFNHRLDERNDVLEKWKSAYEEAAAVARTKDAERAKFESESKSFKASAKACAARNIKLVEVGNELLARIDGVELGNIVGGHEPLIGFKRVEIQNFLRDYQDKILEQRASQ